MGLIEFLNSLDEILFLNLVNWGPDSLDYFFQVLSMSIGTYVLVILFLIFAFFKLKLNGCEKYYVFVFSSCYCLTQSEFLVSHFSSITLPNLDHSITYK